MASATRMVLRGRVQTMAESGPASGSGVVVTNGRVERILDSASASEDHGASVVLDVGARTILPGFLEGHTHVEVASTALSGVDCRAPLVNSIEEIQDQLRDNLHRSDARGGWLVGQANLFFDQKLREKRLPNRDDLDSVSTDVPIVIQAGGHASCVNSKVIELAGLDEGVPNQSKMGGPVIERDSSGRPTGIIGEMDQHLSMPALEPAVLEDALVVGVHDLYLRYGVTTLVEITETAPGVAAMGRAVAANRVPIDVRLALWAPGTYAWPEAIALGASGDVHGLPVQGIKCFLDGGFSARTAAMLTPYVDECGHPTPWRGEMSMSPEELLRRLTDIVSAGLQPIVHTCGEQATKTLSDTVRNPRLQELAPREIRAEHVGNLMVDIEGTLETLEAGGIRPMPNPGFIQAIGDALPEYVGPPAIGKRFPFRTMLSRGFRIAGSSDVHVGADARQGSPLFMMWCSVGRKGFEGLPIDPSEAISVADALKMHTLYAAEALGLADSRGSLEAGKDADIIVLDRDPNLVSDPDELLDINVDFVFRRGELIYERAEAAPFVCG